MLVAILQLEKIIIKFDFFFMNILTSLKSDNFDYLIFLKKNRNHTNLISF